jgi:hypothetical protein
MTVNAGQSSTVNDSQHPMRAYLLQKIFCFFPVASSNEQ